jgi:tetratricopeptide (TPR) repeat protein
MLGHACYRMEAYDRAASAYKEALSQGIQNAGLYLALGNASFSQHAFEEAAEAYENALNHGADSPELTNLLEQAREYAKIA